MANVTIIIFVLIIYKKLIKLSKNYFLNIIILINEDIEKNLLIWYYISLSIEKLNDK